MRRALLKSLKSLTFAAIGGWLAVGPVGYLHGQGAGAAGGTGAQSGGTSGGASVGTGTGAAAGASRQVPAAGGGANVGTAAGVNARTQAGTNAAARTQAQNSNLAPSMRGTAAQNRRTAGGTQGQFDARSRANTARTRTQASSVDTDRMNNPFDSRNDRFDDRFDNRFNDRFDARQSRTFDNRTTDSRLIDNRDNRTDDRPTRTRQTPGAQRPLAPQGLERAGQQLNANQQRFEDRRGFSNPGLDTARDRVQRNLDRFDDRSDRLPDTIDRGARFDAGVGEDELGTGMANDPRLRDRGGIDRGARFDAGVGEDELGTGMVNDPRLRDRSGIDRGARFDAGVGEDELGTGMVDDPRVRDRGGIDRGARFDAGVGEDELGTGMRDDPRLPDRGERRFDRFDVRAAVDPVDRARLPAGVALPRERLDMSRQRIPTNTNGGMAPLSTAVDPRLDAARRTIAAEGQVRSQQAFRDDLGVRRNLSSSTRRAGYRGTTEAVDLERDRFERSTNPRTRVLRERLDRTAPELDRTSDQLNRRAVNERIE
jgi:hypothetical protein